MIMGIDGNVGRVHVIKLHASAPYQARERILRRVLWLRERGGGGGWQKCPHA